MVKILTRDDHLNTHRLEADSAGVGCAAFQYRLLEQKARDDPVDDAQHRREQLGMGGKQNTQWDRKRQHPFQRHDRPLRQVLELKLHADARADGHCDGLLRLFFKLEPLAERARERHRR